VALFPHGVLEVAQHPAPPLQTDAPFVIGSYGFLLPPKGFPELIEAVGLMRDAGRNVALEMVNAAFPVPESTDLKARITTQIADRGLADHVTLCTDFLDNDASYARLSKAHMLAFPYRPTTESASGAVRQALAISRPIAVTPLPIFDDVRGLVLPLPGFTPADIAQGLSAIMDDMHTPSEDSDVARSLARGTGWRQAMGYSALSRRLWAILQQV
jgi:glycosyltransferase involved in cell wall biosynthesis